VSSNETTKQLQDTTLTPLQITVDDDSQQKMQLHCVAHCARSTGPRGANEHVMMLVHVQQQCALVHVAAVFNHILAAPNGPNAHFAIVPRAIGKLLRTSLCTQKNNICDMRLVLTHPTGGSSSSLTRMWDSPSLQVN